MLIGYDPDYDYLLDLQQQRPVCLCVNCGRDIYTRGKDLCEQCEDD